MSTILDVEDPLDLRLHARGVVAGPRPAAADARRLRRFTGRLAKVVVAEPVDGQTAFEGRMRGVEDGAVVLRGPGTEVHRLRSTTIKRARLEVEF